MEEFKGFLVQEKNGKMLRSVESLPAVFLPDNDLLIKVSYSALNYKDALSASGHRGITKKFPHIPGIDAVGEIVKAKGKWRVGQKVIVTSYDLGMNTSGGFGEYISVPQDWPVLLPEGMSEKEAMIYGTSGFTAALALFQMEKMGQSPEYGRVLVTGATGAVGTAAIALLRKAGYAPVASTGKSQATGDLVQLGAVEIISREAVNDDSNKPFLSPKWGGAIDTVGGNTLATILKEAKANANIAVCGLVSSADFSTTVYPFIIKGNNLLGVETATCPREVREEIWKRLASTWAFELPNKMIREVSLDGLNAEIEKMLEGKSYGKVILKHR
ncbi:MAG: YhdH/YhfP family quinone oxidoreductase [Luteibaculum sp.]